MFLRGTTHTCIQINHDEKELPNRIITTLIEFII